ncbi:MAG: diguanylate phosphodiesterase [Planctomycetaceae bacterium]|nr:diguanylate phosphodiesterase [Planctomycetaceae bacterium]
MCWATPPGKTVVTTALHSKIRSCPPDNADWFLSGSLGPGGAITDVPVHPTPFVVGRKPNCSLCLPAPTVSGEHARISLYDDRLLITDLNSTNGTYVNGHRIERPTALNDKDLIQLADAPFRVRAQVTQTETPTQPENPYNNALALVEFDRLMSERLVVPHYQPIVDITGHSARDQSLAVKPQRSRDIVGFEVLGRSDLIGLETPDSMFQAAARLDLEVPLSRMLRWEGIRPAVDGASLPCLFVNTHPAELDQRGLIDSLHDLRRFAPGQPMTLEIHEAAITDLTAMNRLAAALRELEIGLAYDDFGAGQARLVELAEVRPDYVKFDMSLIRDIDTAHTKRQQMLNRLVTMVQELGITPLAEGIERPGELETCRQLGFALGQGFLLGKPTTFDGRFSPTDATPHAPQSDYHKKP